MDNAVTEYKKRRQTRLDAKAVYDYRERSFQRWAARMDADGEEEENAGSGGGSGGGHGNTKIPFGLCQREGIKIEPGWGPKEAWDALAGKGYSASDVYKELKSTGKVEKRIERVNRKTGEIEYRKYKRPEKLDESHFPSEFLTASHKKNTMAFATYINDHCDDAETIEFFGSAMMPGARRAETLKMTKTSASGKSEVVTWSRRDGKVVKTEIKIPNLAGIKGEEEKAQAVRVFAHEWTHFLDLSARAEDRYGHYSDSYKELQEKVRKDDGHYGNEVKKLFDEFNKKYDDLRKEESDAKSRASLKVASGKFADSMGDMPRWITSDGHVDWLAAHRAGKYRQAQEYESEAKKVRKTVEDTYTIKRRALMDGVSNLQGIYDSLSGGELSRTSRAVKYGHPPAYFKKDPRNKAIEIIADYVALKATNPKLLDVFKRDRPELAGMLDQHIVNITKRLRGDG